MIRKQSGVGVKAMGLTALSLLGLAVAGQASAGCMDTVLHKRASLNQDSTAQSLSGMRLVSAVYRPDDTRGASLLKVSETDTASASTTIVGLWQFKFDGFSPDWGTQAWHSDGTEILFSGGQNPETGDVCQGVWKQMGPSTYSLNHIAMGWTAPGGEFGIRVHIHAVVTLNAAGNEYSGKYSASVWSVTPANPFEETVPLGSGTGNLTGERVMPD